MSYSTFRLKQAINNREFTPFYQPVVNRHEDTVGCEILARWMNPVRGLLSAACFIDSVESGGLAGSLTHALVREAVADIPDLPARKAPLLLTLNVSLSQVMDPASRYDLLAMNIQLRQAGVNPVFEVTEREDVQMFPCAAIVFDGLAAQGMQFAVDDFGAGYAGEALLRTTQATLIKIDRRFISGQADQFIEKTLGLARLTGARVLAEGVETPAQASRLRSAGVDYLQGIYYGTPMPFGLFQYHLNKNPWPARCES